MASRSTPLWTASTVWNSVEYESVFAEISPKSVRLSAIEFAYPSPGRCSAATFWSRIWSNDGPPANASSVSAMARPRSRRRQRP